LGHRAPARAPSIGLIIVSPLCDSASTSTKCADELEARLDIPGPGILTHSISRGSFLCRHTYAWSTLRHLATRGHLDQIANIVVLAPPSSGTQILVPTPLQPLSTGLAPPVADAALTNDDAPYDSESDLSEVAVPIIDEPSPAASTNHQPEFGAQGTEDFESSAAEAQGESDDADFDMEESPAAAAANDERHDRSSSVESRRPVKRKLGVKEDEHILANPELYGLRRSVRCQHFRLVVVTLTCAS
jgi:hypothetical protein